MKPATEKFPVTLKITVPARSQVEAERLVRAHPIVGPWRFSAEGRRYRARVRRARTAQGNR